MNLDSFFSFTFRVVCCVAAVGTVDFFWRVK